MTAILDFDFMRRALVAAALVGLIAPLIGVFLVQRRLALLGDGRLRELPGGVEEYLRLRAAAAGGPASTWDAGRSAAAAVATAAAVSASAGPGSAGTAGGGQTASTTPAVPAASPAEAREARKTMARVEKQLSRLADREAKLHAAMLTAATDHARVLVLNRELREIVDEREDLELQWLEAAEIIG